MAAKFVVDFGSGVVIDGQYYGVTAAFPRILARTDWEIASPRPSKESCQIASTCHWPRAEHSV